MRNEVSEPLCFVPCTTSCGALPGSTPSDLQCVNQQTPRSSGDMFPRAAPRTQAAAPAEARSFPDPVRSFLCLQTMLLRHPHAAPSNALQRKMAEEKEPASETARRGQLRSAAESEEAGTSGWRLADWQTGLPEEPPSPVPSPHHCNRRTQGQTPEGFGSVADFKEQQKSVNPLCALRLACICPCLTRPG